MDKKRTVYLDIIRIIACIMVIIMHAPISGIKAESHGSFLVLLSYLTAPCVPLFFMVSGALLLPCKPEVNAIDYFKKRIGKVIGPTIFFSLFYISVNSPDNLLKSILSIPFSTQGHGVLWFMYTLIGLYLLIPLISPWLRQATKKELEFYIILWIITLLYPYISKFLMINNSDTGILYYFSGYLGYFILGYYLNRFDTPFKIIVPLFIIILPLPLFNKILSWNFDFYSAFWYLSAPVSIMATTWFVFIKKLFKSSNQNNFVTNLSNLSFGIYLIHIFIMRRLLWNIEFIQNIPNYPLQTIVVALLTFIISYIICKIIAYCPYSQYIIGYKYKNV